MARKIIILRALNDVGPDVGYRYALWADVPAARQARYANAAFVSEVKSATAGEITALTSGAVTEKVDEARWPAGTTVPQVQTFLQNQFNTFQAFVNVANPWQRTDTAWDGTTWDVKNNG